MPLSSQVMFHAFFMIFLLLVAQPFTVHPRSLRSTKAQSQHSQRNSEAIKKSNETPQTSVSVATARRYLHAFGYLEEEDINAAGFININTNITNRRMNNAAGDDNNGDDEFDEGLEKAIKKVQQYYHLNVSGKLDSETTKLMMLPRCGVPDRHHHHHHHHDSIGSNLIKVGSKYAFLQGILPWPNSKRNLTYTFDSSVEVLPQEVVKDAFKFAFEQWSNVSQFTFEEVPIIGTNINPDLVIGFFGGDHGDGAPFKKFGAILAHAFGPPDGRLHVNADEPWSTQVPIQEGFYDLVWVAMHEIGHTLGLDHSHDRDAVMYALVDPGVNKRKLSVDDINGIKRLYSLPIRMVGSPAVALRSDYYHLLTIVFLCLLVIFLFSDMVSSGFFD